MNGPRGRFGGGGPEKDRDSPVLFLSNKFLPMTLTKVTTIPRLRKISRRTTVWVLPGVSVLLVQT